MSDKMITAARMAKNKYQREWKKRNPEKTKEYQLRYWERRALREQEISEESQSNGKPCNEN